MDFEGFQEWDLPALARGRYVKVDDHGTLGHIEVAADGFICLHVYLAILVDLNGIEAMPALAVITELLANEKAPGLEKLGKEATYDAEHRDLIVELAESYLKNTKPEDYRAAEAMTPDAAWSR